MKISRIWAMPNRWTFTIKPIKELLNRYITNGKGWIDPFAGENSPAEFTNDLNPIRPTVYHLTAKDFIKKMTSKYNGILFDPPYSSRQVKECYEKIGRKMTYKDTLNGAFHIEKNMIAPKIKIRGYAISFGWNSIGFGKKRGFKIIEILLVSHGGQHNDTIVTVEQKSPNSY